MVKKQKKSKKRIDDLIARKQTGIEIKMEAIRKYRWYIEEAKDEIKRLKREIKELKKRKKGS